MERVIQEHIKKPLADMVLFGDLAKGGTASISVNPERTDLAITVMVEEKEVIEV
jgi:ATP-dependent Clp protease ATP-binding subunit ClpA